MNQHKSLSGVSVVAWCASKLTAELGKMKNPMNGELGCETKLQIRIFASAFFFFFFLSIIFLPSQFFLVNEARNWIDYCRSQLDWFPQRLA